MKSNYFFALDLKVIINKMLDKVLTHIKNIFHHKICLYFVISNLIFFFHFLILMTTFKLTDCSLILAFTFLFLIFFMQNFLLCKSQLVTLISDSKISMILIPSLLVHLYIIYYLTQSCKSSVFSFESLIIVFYCVKSYKNSIFFKLLTITCAFVFSSWNFFWVFTNLVHFFLYQCFFFLLFFKIISKQSKSKTQIQSKSKIQKNEKMKEIFSKEKSLQPNNELSNKSSSVPFFWNSIKEGILVIDKNFHIKWSNNYLFKLFNLSEDSSIQEVESRLILIKQDDKYVRIQNMSFKSEDEYSQLFKVFKTKIAVLQESMCEMNELDYSPLLRLPNSRQSFMIKKTLTKNFASKTLGIMNTLSSEKTPLDLKSKLKCIYYLNKNGEFEVESKKKVIPKSIKDYLQNIFDGIENFKKKSCSFYFNEFNMYGTYEGCGTPKLFYISFFPMDEEIIIVLKNVPQNNLVLNTWNNYLIQNKILASMCHELRTPLNSITNMLELIETDSKNNNNNKSYLEYIHDAIMSSKLLLCSINDFLDYFSVSTNIFEIEMTEFHLHNVIYECFTLFKLYSEKKSINFTLQYPEEIPIICYNDEKRLKQILVNLLNNAFKFTNNGSSVLLKIKHRGNFIEIIITDNGNGIDSQNLKFLANFLKNQTNQTTAGFGLCISNHLANHIGPNVEDISKKIYKGIKVKTETGKGSKFSFLLDAKSNYKSDKSFNTTSENLLNDETMMPLDKRKTTMEKFNHDHDIDAKFLNSKPTTFASQNINNSSMRDTKTCDCSKLLAVDDNDFNLFVLTEQFKRREIFIDVAHSGNDAIDKIKQIFEHSNDEHIKFCKNCKMYKLILMDIDMPEKNGYETALEMTSLFKKYKINIPIVALSAFGQKESKAKALEAGMVYYLEKPFSQESLECIFSKYLN